MVPMTGQQKLTYTLQRLESDAEAARASYVGALQWQIKNLTEALERAKRDKEPYCSATVMQSSQVTDVTRYAAEHLALQRKAQELRALLGNE